MPSNDLRKRVEAFIKKRVKALVSGNTEEIVSSHMPSVVFIGPDGVEVARNTAENAKIMKDYYTLARIRGLAKITTKIASIEKGRAGRIRVRAQQTHQSEAGGDLGISDVTYLMLDTPRGFRIEVVEFHQFAGYSIAFSRGASDRRH